MENNTILVIDDDRNILAIIELYLKKAGFQVYTCADGISAMAAFHETKPSLVVLDIMLPGRDGWAVLHDIRMESETPVIMLTAKGDTGDRVQGLELGADDYIAKPFDAKELIARIKAVLRRSTPVEPERTISLPGLTVSLRIMPSHWTADSWKCLRRRSNCCISLRPIPARCSRANSCLNRSGGSTFSAIRVRWTST